MPIDSSFSPLRRGDLGGQREMRRRRFVGRRDAHQAGDREPVGLAAGLEEVVGGFRQDAGLLRLGAGIDLDEQQRAAGPAGRSPAPAPRTGSAGRANGSRRTAPPRRAPCSTAAGRRDAARSRDGAAVSAGHLAFASCTRFSPNTRWPAAITGSIASASNVFEIATSVTDAGSRPASAQALAMASRTAVEPLRRLVHLIHPATAAHVNRPPRSHGRARNRRREPAAPYG